MSFFSSTFCLLSLEFTSRYFLLITYLLLWCLRDDDFLSLSFCLQRLEFFCRKEQSLLHLFVYSIAYFSVPPWYLSCPMGHTLSISFVAQMISSVDVRCPFTRLSCFQHAPILSTFLVSGFSSVTLYFPCLSPRINRFFKELPG